MGVILAILGGIVKWVFLAILAILGLILLVLLILLLTPLRYRIAGKYNEETAGGELQLSYLLHLFSVKARWQKKQELRWEIKLGPKVVAASYPLPEKKRWRRKKSKAPAEEAQSKQAEEVPPSEEGASSAELAAEKEEMPVPESRPSAVPESMENEISPADPKKLETELPQEPLPAAPEKEKSEHEEEPRQGCLLRGLQWMTRKLKALAYWIVRLLRRLYETKESLRERWEALRRKWESYPQKAETVRAVKDVAVGLVKPVFPRRFQASVRFGFSDPATTGKVLGYYYAIYPLLVPKETRRKRLAVEADFERPVLEAEGELCGHMAAWEFAAVLIRALLNPHIRRLIRYIRTKQK